MHKLTLCSLVLLVLATLAAAPAGAMAQGNDLQVRVAQVDTSHYPDVTLYVNANDSAGIPRAGLQKQDFSITEDGVPVEIKDFAGSGQTPVSTLLVMDCSASMRE